ncbi:hypothetical protein acdb102_31610 [Acidothermaceae bacterium B102]|nr:hypothetical protein acdb102_31610 [Acidothermaceae bacterium B102]
MTFGMIVELRVSPGHMGDVLAVFESVMPRVRGEDGCLAFSLFPSTTDPLTLFLYESYVSERYHDDVHESFAEVKDVLAQLPQHLSAPWVVHQGDHVLAL